MYTRYDINKSHDEILTHKREPRIRYGFESNLSWAEAVTLSEAEAGRKEVLNLFCGH
jgi:hypothetical protein